jgi:RHH-type proline utilization regulon transcriptional repressor/proline dehydrogenase/delta 1-pyrroline-5-carboxylate dehydrogenase
MTYEALSHGLAGMGWPTRNYMPIGNLLVGMAYLVRRIMENSSQVGILTIMRSHNKKEAFQTPWKTHQEKKAQGILQRDSLEVTSSSEFKNCTPRRLYVSEELDEFTAALKSFGTHVQESQAKFSGMSGLKIPCSSHPELIVGVIQEVSAAEALEAAKLAYQGMQQGNGWSEAPLAVRAGVLLKAADRMWQRRDELSALIVYEAGKTWSEALADVDEAIDFINFYVREELRLVGKKKQPRGVMAVIAPWNFPLAIPCGMAVAPLVAGNAVVLKPAEQTPLIARELAELLWNAGVPKNVLFFTPGDGLVVGAPLVQDPHVAGIVFTGSKTVGQWIYQTASSLTVRHPQTAVALPKKVITEMGGKNAIIVTNNCEQDETVSGILYSAFGHAGQKCSACSRVLVDSEVKDSLLKRLVKAVEDLEVGKATEGQVLVNPLITVADQERVRAAVKEAVREARELGGKVWVDRSMEETGSFAVGPVLIELPASRARQRDSWAQREVFGPVLHIISYDTLDEAIELFNSTEYGLTGGIYGQSQDDIDYLSARLLCGNLYVNRPNTGARVAIEPFGGFKLSGTGPKAGGSDYLSQFHVHFGQNDESVVSEWGQGSGFKFELPQASGLGVAARLSRWHKLAEQTLTRFEALTGTVNEADKRILKNFIQWVSVHGTQTLQEGRSHLRIPGQLSFGLRDAPRESLLIVMMRPRPQLLSLMHWLSALAAGTGVAVACTSQESYSYWKGLCDAAWQAGFSHNNLEVYLVSKSELEEMQAHEGLAAQYISAPAGSRDEILRHSLPPGSLRVHMRALYHDGEHPSFESPQDWIELYVYVRAFAVNTMRHGAPLELGV